jgi:hypothetical protein
MSDRETFLARWSRRKQGAAEPVEAGLSPVPPQVASAAPVEGKAPVEGTAGIRGPSEDRAASAAGNPDAGEPLFDPASLPPIESIVADTDVRAFLAPGVPPELARAALRRAWATDPKIRDFVGLADYDWDFNAPGSIAGFGPLEMTQELREIAARIIGPPPAAEAAAESSKLSGQAGSRGESARAELVHDVTGQGAEESGRVPPSEHDPAIVATQAPTDAAEKSRLVVQPRHGGALPK